MEKQLNCGLCHHLYQKDHIPRLLTMCGHTFCDQCIKSLISKKKDGKFRIVCPEDGNSMDLQSNKACFFPKNVALMKVVQLKKIQTSVTIQNLKGDSYKDNNSFFELDISTNEIGKSQTYHTACQSPNASLIKANQRSNNQSQVQLCLLHQKPLDIACIQDLTRICANCAIFGQHKGHCFKGVNEIQNEAKNRCEEILKIINKKNFTQKQLENEEIQKQIWNTLNKKKLKIKKQVSEQYKKIIQSLKQSEKQNQARIDLFVCQAQDRIRNLFKIDNKILKQYNQWEITTLMQIKIFESENIQEKISLLFGPDNLIQNNINMGHKILQELKLQEDNFEKDIEKIIQNIGVYFNQEIYNLIRGCVKVFDCQEDKIAELLETKNLNEYRLNTQQAQCKPYYSLEESLLDICEEQYQPQMLKMSVDSPKLRKDFSCFRSSQAFFDTSKTPNQKKLVNVASEKDMKKNTAKKRNPKIKVPENYQKTLDSIIKNLIQIVDFTGAQLGDQIVIQICELLGSKVKTLKLAKNKITDQGLKMIMGLIKNITILNLAQNSLTDNCLIWLEDVVQQMPNLQSIVLSQNKISERKNRQKLQKIKKFGINISI